MKNPNIRLASFIGLFFVAALLLCASTHILGDPDTYWHIGAGRWVLVHHELPHADPFSNSMRGTPWVPHEWLTEVIFAGVFHFFGWTGIILINTLAAAIGIALFGYFASRWLDPLMTTFLTGTAYLLLAPHLLARPHIMALPFMMWFIGGLVVARAQKTTPSLWLLPAMTIWANLHGAYSMGIGFAGYFSVEALLQDGWKHGRNWLLFFAAVVAAGLVTPNGINSLLVLKEYFTDQKFAMSMITEWQSPNFQSIQPLEIWLLGFLFLCLAIGIRVPITRLLIVLGLLHLALQHVRNVELVGLISPLVLLPSVAPQVYAAMARDFFHIRISPLLMRTAIVVVGIALTQFFVTGHQRENGMVSPIAAVSAAESAGATGPVFNSYAFGGYLIYSGIPPFIDGRSEMYGDAFLKAYSDAVNDDKLSTLTSLIEKYQFGWALVQPTAAANLKFAEMPGWQRVYHDEYAVVYVQKDHLAQR